MRQLPRLKRHSTLFPRILKHFINGCVVKAVKSRRHGSLWWRTTIASQAFYTQEEFKLLWERYIFIFWSNPLYCISSPKYFYTHMMNHIFLHEKGFLFVLAKYSCVLFSFQMPVVPQPVIFTAYSAKDILFGSGNNKFGKGPSKTTKVSHSEKWIVSKRAHYRSKRQVNIAATVL